MVNGFIVVLTGALASGSSFAGILSAGFSSKVSMSIGTESSRFKVTCTGVSNDAALVCGTSTAAALASVASLISLFAALLLSPLISSSEFWVSSK